MSERELKQLQTQASSVKSLTLTLTLTLCKIHTYLHLLNLSSTCLWVLKVNRIPLIPTHHTTVLHYLPDSVESSSFQDPGERNSRLYLVVCCKFSLEYGLSASLPPERERERESLHKVPVRQTDRRKEGRKERKSRWVNLIYPSSIESLARLQPRWWCCWEEEEEEALGLLLLTLLLIIKVSGVCVCVFWSLLTNLKRGCFVSSIFSLCWEG